MFQVGAIGIEEEEEEEEEEEVSLLYSQEPSIGPYPEPKQS
jgi:hypothetical protein